jgi:hypothetical protein
MEKQDVIKMEQKKTKTDNSVYGNIKGIVEFHLIDNFFLKNGKTLSDNIIELLDEVQRQKEINKILKDTILDLSSNLEDIQTMLKKYGLE